MQSEHPNFTPLLDTETLEPSDVVCPFYSPQFFNALHLAGCTGVEQGWQAAHFNYQQWILPGYFKQHSYGEYIFDWSIAQAVEQAGVNYYPKWVCQLPFTPISMSQPAFLRKQMPAQQQPTSLAELVAELLEQLAKRNVLTAQFLYPHASLAKQLAPLMLTRHSIQFYWQNQNYRDFKDYLDGLNQKRAKDVRRERRKVSEMGIECRWLNAEELTADAIKRFMPFYQRTYLKRSGHAGYLNQDFFLKWLLTFRDRVHLVEALKSGETVACALFIESNDELYGRYYGSYCETDFLHFEICYYQAIEYAIARKFTRVNPGVQGEHKVRRGFAPELTPSYYRYFNSSLERSIAAAFQQETRELRQYLNYLNQRLPFKASALSGD
ncbi:MAG: GNAT family N-acetyltransferase [Gammaproteobacteria bacterium]|nr:GNAT family N-acetyltransferase [Gammaproteobacteria bacterium]